MPQAIFSIVAIFLSFQFTSDCFLDTKQLIFLEHLKLQFIIPNSLRFFWLKMGENWLFFTKPEIGKAITC